MKEGLTSFYNRIYKEHEVVFAEGEPEKHVKEIPKLLTEGSVLDIGGGEGRNALFLAQSGFDVHVIDLAVEGLNKIVKKAEMEGINTLTVQVGDITQEGIHKMYEVMVSSFMVHHLLAEHAHTLIDSMKAHTNEGGLNSISAFMSDARPEHLSVRFYPEKNELRDMYSDWEIVDYTETKTTTRERNADGGYGVATTAFLLARKPLTHYGNSR